MAVTVAASVAPAAAQAHRAPTAQERARIVLAIRGGIRGSFLGIHFRRVEVSSKGPWATAAFNVTFAKGKRPVPSSVVLVKARDGRWFEAGSKGAPNVTPSKPVSADLHLYSSPPDSAFPRHHTASSGASNRTIHLIEIILGVVFGVLVVLAMVGAARNSEAVAGWMKRDAEAAEAARAKARAVKGKCSSCGGSGKKKTEIPCHLCGGRGVIAARNEYGNMEYGPCRGSSHGTFTVSTCESCHGTGESAW